MKMLFRFCKTLLTCVLFFYIVSSCNDSSTTSKEKTEQDSDTTKSFLTGPIIIKGGNTTTGELYFKNNIGHSIVVSRSAIINWELLTHSIVQSIDTIAIDSSVNNNYDVFDDHPHQQGSPNHWQGTIKDSTAFPTNSIYIEKYYIEWTDTVNQKHKYDPFIQVNPK